MKYDKHTGKEIPENEKERNLLHKKGIDWNFKFYKW